MLAIIPAIDLKSGKCVRLRQGRPDQATAYSDDPVSMALRWESEGAERLHVVDLDGAFKGEPVHLEIISRIAAAMRIPVQVGGGLRDVQHIRDALSIGAAAVVVGTTACLRPDQLSRLASQFGERLIVAIDAKDGIVRTEGWTRKSSLGAAELARSVEEAGIGTIIYTDVSRDGMLGGPNIKAVERMCGSVKCDIIAAGGISSPSDVSALVGLGLPNLKGAIVGKALYDGRASLRDLMLAARQNE